MHLDILEISVSHISNTDLKTYKFNVLILIGFWVEKYVYKGYIIGTVGKI